MSVYLEDDGDLQEQAATNQGWSDFGDWVTTLSPKSAPNLHHLYQYGWCQDVPGLLSELANMTADFAPTDATVASTIRGVVAALKLAGGAVVVTDGMGSHSDTDDPASDSIHVNGPAVKMADPTPATPAATPGPPASGEVALAGADGKALARLIRQAKDRGVEILSGIVSNALKRYSGGPLLNRDELHELADQLAAVNSTAELLGRSRVRELQSHAATFAGAHKFPDRAPSLSMFADGLPGVLGTPHDALDYFLSLFPTLGVDSERFAGEQRRRAFTLAESANQALTFRVQQLIAQSLRGNESAADATARIRDTLSGAGVTPRNPQYAEMVFRTNAMDSFQTGMWEEGQSSDIAEDFPAWQYLGIDDERAGADHRPKFDRFYPRTASFAAVRGNRPYNCRCSMRWVDRWEWDDIQTAGGHAETR